MTPRLQACPGVSFRSRLTVAKTAILEVTMAASVLLFVVSCAGAARNISDFDGVWTGTSAYCPSERRHFEVKLRVQDGDVWATVTRITTYTNQEQTVFTRVTEDGEIDFFVKPFFTRIIVTLEPEQFFTGGTLMTSSRRCLLNLERDDT